MSILVALQNIFGWIYFIAWSISWYPQLMLFFRRKTAAGYSTNFLAINIVGFLSYAIFTFSSYFSAKVTKSYEAHISFDPQVDFSDVVFAINGSVMCTLVVFLVLYYPPRTPPNRIVAAVCAAILIAVLVGLALCLSGKMDWYDYLLVAGYVKVLSTLSKYVPQAYLNYKRKSTIGWSYVSVVQDIIGGVFSLLQQTVHCIRLGNLEPFTGNPAKFLLALVSLFFDAIFVIQHTCLYTNRTDIDAMIKAEMEEGDYQEIAEDFYGEEADFEAVEERNEESLVVHVRV